MKEKEEMVQMDQKVPSIKTHKTLEESSLAVENAMGDVLDHVQGALDVPIDESGKSTTHQYNYSIYAQVCVQLNTDWEIVPGFALKGVTLKSSVNKTRNHPAALAVKLSAYMVIQDIAIMVTGSIPRLQKGRDVSFTLELVAQDTLEDIPVQGLLDLCGKVYSDSRGSTNGTAATLLEGQHLPDPGFAAGARVTIVRSHKSESYHLKEFEISLGKNVDWEIIPSKLRLRRAAAVLRFSKERQDDSYDAYFGLDGTFEVAGSASCRAMAKVFIEENSTVLRLSCDVSALQGIRASEAMDMLAGQPVFEESSKTLIVPPGLESSTRLSSTSFQILTVLERKDSQWRLNYAQTSLSVRLGWKPLPGIDVTDLKFFFVASRIGYKRSGKNSIPGMNPNANFNDELQLVTQNESSLAFSASITGRVVIAEIPLAVSVLYDSINRNTTLSIYIEDGKMVSLAYLIRDPAIHQITDRDQGIIPAENHHDDDTLFKPDDFDKQLSATNSPLTCPVDMHWVSNPHVGTNRKFKLLLKDAKLSRMIFEATFAEKENSWKLTDKLTLENMGIWFDYQPPVSLSSVGTLKGFVYGSINITTEKLSVKIFGLAAGMKDSAGHEFSLYLSATLNPYENLGISPETLFQDQRMQDLKPETEGWELPSDLQTKQTPSSIFQSASASVALRFLQTKLDNSEDREERFETSLLLASVTSSLKLDWEVFPGLSLREVNLAAILRPENNTAKQQASTIIVAQGVMEAEIDEMTRHRLSAIAEFKSRGPCRSFVVRLAAIPTTDDDKEHGSEQAPLPISPLLLMGLPAFGGNALEVRSEDGVPEDLPIQPKDLISSKKVDCSFEVVKITETSDWSLSKVDFSMAWKDEPWVIIPNKLRILAGSLRLSVNSPKDPKNRKTSAFISTTVDIGGLLLDGKGAFRKSDAAEIVTLEIKAQGAEVHSLVQTLTGQSLEKLTPPETPILEKDGHILAVKITCLSVSSETGKTYRLQSLVLQWQPEAIYHLTPFEVQRLTVMLTWTVRAGKEELGVSIKGDVKCGNTQLDISLLYNHSEPNRIQFSAQEKLTTIPISLEDLVLSFHIDKPKYDSPKDLAPFDSVRLDGIHGYVEFKSVSTPQTRLSVLDAKIISDQKLMLLNLSDDIKIELHHFGLEWHYEAEKGSRGSVYAYMRCRNAEGPTNTNSDVLLKHIKEEDNEVFVGSLSIGESNLTFEGRDILTRFVPSPLYTVPTKVNLPEQIPLFQMSVKVVSGFSFDFDAVGNLPWKPPLVGADLTIEKMGLHFNVRRVLEGEKFHTEAEVCITGQAKLNNLESIDTAKARFSIGTATNAVLRATLEKKGSAPARLDQLNEQLSAPSITSMMPQEALPLSFTDGGRYLLHIDFKELTNVRILLTGQISDIGSGLFFTRMDPNNAERQYIVSLSLQKLTDIFPPQITQSEDLEDVSAAFHLRRLAMEIITYDGTVKQLQNDLDACTKTLSGNFPPINPEEEIQRFQHAKDASKIIYALDQDEPIAKGAWFFAEIGLDDNSEMTKALRLCSGISSEGGSAAIVHPQDPSITLFVHLPKSGSRNFRVVLRDLWPMGREVTPEGKIHGVVISGKGIYTPTNKNTQPITNRKLQLEAKVEVFGLQTKSPLELNATLVLEQEQTQITGEICNISLLSPLDGMFNITLEKLRIGGIITKKNRWIWIAAEASLGATDNPSRQSLSSEIRFVDGRPRLVLVKYEKKSDPAQPPGTAPTISGGDIFTDIIRPGASTEIAWPDNLPMVCLKEAYIYYNSGTAFAETTEDYRRDDQLWPDQTVRTFQEGLWVGAKLDIFGHAFVIEGHIMQDRSGLNITGMYGKPIDLYFVQFIGCKISENGVSRKAGPSLSLKALKNSQTYEVAAGLQLFGTELADITFSYKTNSKALEVEVNITEGALKGISVKFSYSDKGFLLERWNLNHYFDLDMNEAIKLGSKDHKCDEIVKNVFDKVIQTEFQINLKAPEDMKKLVDVEGLHAKMDLSYAVHLLGEKIGSIPVGDLTLTLHRPWSADGIWEKILDELRKNLGEIGKQLMAKPEIFGKVLAKMAVEKLAVKTLNSIFCRGVDDSEVVEKARDATKSEWQRIKEKIEKLFSRDGDTDKVEEMKALDKEIGEEKERVRAGQKEVKKSLGDKIFVNGQCVAKFLDESSDTIQVKWKGLEGVKLEKPLTALTWGVTYSTDPTFPEGQNTQKFNIQELTAESHQHTNLEYRFAKTVFVRVQAHLTMKLLEDDEEEGPKEETQTLEHSTAASHVPVLQSPTGLLLETKQDPVAPVVFFNTAPGQRYELLVYATSNPARYPLYSSVLTAGPEETRVACDVRLLSVRIDDFNGLEDTVKACVRALTPDISQAITSDWSESQEAVPAKRYIQELRTRMESRKIHISWNAIDFHMYQVLIFDRSDKVIWEGLQGTETAENGRLFLLVDVPKGCTEGDNLWVAISPTDIPKDVCPLFYKSYVTVAFVPVVRINDSSKNTAFYFGKKELVLELAYEFRPDPSRLQLETIDEEGTVKTVTEPNMSIRSLGEGSGLIALMQFQPPYPTTLRVVTSDISRRYLTRGPAWKLMAIPRDFHACRNLSSQIKDGKLAFEWDYPDEVNQAVVSVIGGGKTVSKEVSHDRVGSNTLLRGMTIFGEISMENEQETSFTLNVTPIYGTNVYGEIASSTCRVQPSFTNWTAPEVAFPYKVGPIGNFTTPTTREIPTVVFGSGAWTLVTGGRDGLKKINIMSVGGALQDGTVLASTSLSEGHEEVYWITGNGAINGLVNNRGDGSWVPGDYKFNSPNAAVTRHGGAITAIADKEGGILHVWWVTETFDEVSRRHKSCIAYSNCKPNVWWSSPQLLYRKTWDNEVQESYIDENCITPLACAVASGGYATVWYMSKDDGLVSVTRKGDEAAVNYCVYDSTSPASGICVTNGRLAGEHRVFWTTAKGAIMTALVDPAVAIGTRYDGRQEPKSTSEIAPPGSASLRTSIAAVLAPGGDPTDLRVWWFTEDGRLMGAKAENGKHKKPAYTIYEQAPAGSGRREGRMHVAVTKWDQPPFRVWWIDSNNEIKYQAPNHKIASG